MCVCRGGGGGSGMVKCVCVGGGGGQGWSSVCVCRGEGGEGSYCHARLPHKEAHTH